MMLVTKKSDSISGKKNLRAKNIVRRIQEDCYDEHQSLIPEQFEEGKKLLAPIESYLRLFRASCTYFERLAVI